MKILLKGKDGSVAIMSLAEGADKEEAVRKFKESHPDEYIDHFEFEGELPESREFRDAWTLIGGKIVVDRSKAMGIHMRHIRQVRNQELINLDNMQLRHLFDLDKLKELDEKKQVLRDLPKNVKNLEWPESLPH